MVPHRLLVGLEVPENRSEVILIARCEPLCPQSLQSKVFSCDCSMQALPVRNLLGASSRSLDLVSSLVWLIHDSIAPVLRAWWLHVSDVLTDLFSFLL